MIVLGYRSYRVVGKTKEANYKNMPSRQRMKAWEPLGKANSTFEFKKRAICTTETEADSSANSIDIWINDTEKQSIECFFDHSLGNSFQIGRLPGTTNDFVVPGPLYGSSGWFFRQKSESS